MLDIERDPGYFRRTLAATVYVSIRSLFTKLAFLLRFTSACRFIYLNKPAGSRVSPRRIYLRSEVAIQRTRRTGRPLFALESSQTPARVGLHVASRYATATRDIYHAAVRALLESFR